MCRNATHLGRLATRRQALAAAPLLLGAAAGAKAAGRTDNAGPEALRIPAPRAGVDMHALLYRPIGAPPHSLAIVAHGSSHSAERRARHTLAPYAGVAGALVALGYATLVPQRPGHGMTGGPFLEDQGGCDDADFRGAAEAIADSLGAALLFMRGQRSVRADRTIVLGQSAGGWGALALVARNPPGLRAVVNIAGGLGGHSYDRPFNNCSPERLVEAAHAVGATARVPTLWLYAENDSYFPPALSRRMVEAFRAGGGRAEYRLLPAQGTEGHVMVYSEASRPMWETELARFLRPLV